MLKATPQRFSPWLVPAAAPHKPAELRDPAHGLTQRGWTLRRGRTVMDGTIEGLPFLDLQQHVTRHLGHRPRQHDGVKHRQAMTLYSVKQRSKRSPVANWRASM